MKFIPTGLAGAFVINIEPIADDRGYFARLWCGEEFAAQGISMNVVQTSVSHNPTQGTLRGMHFQWPPSQEAKLVRCQRGRVHDVILDLRPGSSTFAAHFAVELDSERQNALFIPSGFAHGFQTLQADCDITYMMSDVFCPELAGGVRYDDPAFAIDWPLALGPIAERDRNYADFDPIAHGQRYSQSA